MRVLYRNLRYWQTRLRNALTPDSVTDAETNLRSIAEEIDRLIAKGPDDPLD
jgi:hypothetical protein